MSPVYYIARSEARLHDDLRTARRLVSAGRRKEYRWHVEQARCEYAHLVELRRELAANEKGRAA